MKIDTSPVHAYQPKPATLPVISGRSGGSSFASELAQAQAAETRAEALPEEKTSKPDFKNMTKADYVAWGKTAFHAGKISLDDLFQVQIAGGDFDGSVNSDTANHNFVSYFNGLIDNEIKAGRASDPKSIVPAYKHVLESMANFT